MKIESKYFMDSSAWLAYFLAEDKKLKEYAEREYMRFTSVLSLFEVKRKLLREKFPKDQVAKALLFIENQSILLDVDQILSEETADLSIKYKLPTVDALIYASSLDQGCTLITGDPDFKGLKDVILLI